MKKKQLLLILALAGSAVSFGQVDRTTLVETFTSSTCPPCNPGNIALENLLADPQNTGKQVSLKYQMSWPGTGDPYFTDEGEIRRGVYGVNGVPNTQLDGGGDFNPSNLTQSDFNSAYAIAPKAIIDATYSVNMVTQTVDVNVDVEVLVNTPPGVRVYIAIFEYQTTNNVKSNGETEFFHVMKKMLPDASGTVMSPMTAGDVYSMSESWTFNGSYVLPPNATAPVDHAIEHTVEEFDDLGVVVWLQQLSTREVYQAGYAVLANAGLEDNENVLSSAKIYPNPAQDQAVVAFQSTENQDFTIEVVNNMGQIVQTTLLENVEAGRTTHDLDISELTNGLYTVRITSEKGMLSKRLSVQH